jgi:hypothetical protein
LAVNVLRDPLKDVLDAIVEGMEYRGEGGKLEVVRRSARAFLKK